MEFFANPEFWVRWFGIVILDLSLAGDNALLIAMAVRTLPPREQFLGRVGGTFGAVALRFVFIAIITQLLRIPFVQAIGGLVLIWIAVKLLRHANEPLPVDCLARRRDPRLGGGRDGSRG